MKKLVSFVFIVAVIVAVGVVGTTAQQPTAIAQIWVTNTSTTVPIQLVTTNLQFTSATIRGMRFNQITNTGPVHIGFGKSVNGEQGLTIDAGSWITISGGTAHGGALYNMSNIWMDVSTANDGVVIFYER